MNIIVFYEFFNMIKNSEMNFKNSEMKNRILKRIFRIPNQNSDMSSEFRDVYIFHN